MKEAERLKILHAKLEDASGSLKDALQFCIKDTLVEARTKMAVAKVDQLIAYVNALQQIGEES